MTTYENNKRDPLSRMGSSVSGQGSVVSSRTCPPSSWMKGGLAGVVPVPPPGQAQGTQQPQLGAKEVQKEAGQEGPAKKKKKKKKAKRSARPGRSPKAVPSVPPLSRSLSRMRSGIGVLNRPARCYRKGQSCSRMPRRRWEQPRILEPELISRSGPPRRGVSVPSMLSPVGDLWSLGRSCNNRKGHQ